MKSIQRTFWHHADMSKAEEASQPPDHSITTALSPAHIQETIQLPQQRTPREHNDPRANYTAKADSLSSGISTQYTVENAVGR